MKKSEEKLSVYLHTSFSIDIVQHFKYPLQNSEFGQNFNESITIFF